MKNCKCPVDYFEIAGSDHSELCSEMKSYSDILLVFPLYVDGIPAAMLEFLKDIEQNIPAKSPTVSVLINCGFLEYEQNDVAVRIVEQFCRKAGCPFGAVLKIGSGEAILTTPFRFLVARKIKILSRSIASKKYKTLNVTMPLPPQIFVNASTNYWLEYGRRNGITEEEMKIIDIEKEKCGL